MVTIFARNTIMRKFAKFVRLYIFHTLQHFSTKFWNFTTFKRFFPEISFSCLDQKLVYNANNIQFYVQNLGIYPLSIVECTAVNILIYSSITACTNLAKTIGYNLHSDKFAPLTFLTIKRLHFLIE